MTVTKRDLSVIIPFIIFVSIGVYGLFSVDFIEGDPTMDFTFKWFGIPIILLAAYYAFRATFGYDRSVAIWRNIIGFIVMTFITGMILFISFQGLIILINNNIGNHKDYHLHGQIVRLDYPEEKKAGNKYFIDIKRDIEKDTLNLVVPTNHYVQGQLFSKMMKIGSFGFIYSKD